MVKFSLSIEGLDCGLNPVSYAVLAIFCLKDKYKKTLVS